MDRRTSFALLADNARRRVTRFQIRQIQQVFPFLELPGEIRNFIYTLCINFSGIDSFFDKYCDVLLNEKERRRRHRVARKKTPTIFLLNKQIYREAVYLLHNEKLIFRHGLLKIKHLHKVISPEVLRRVASIEVSDVGHPILTGNILPESWHGYMRLLDELPDILAERHKLKELIISFSDPRLKEHMSVCFDAHSTFECGFRDGLRDAMNGLRKIRGVGKATLKGINVRLAAQIKAHIESRPKAFFDLPRELRDMIYEQALNWSDISKSLVRGIANWQCTRQPFPYIKPTTPTVLLINKQINTEAIKVLHKKPLVITFPTNGKIDGEKQVPQIMRLISRHTLKQAKVVHITMESWQWIFNISRSLVAALAASPNLEVFHLVIKDDLKKAFLNLTGQHYPDDRLHATLKKLAQIRGLKEVCFRGGDLPGCYTDTLTRIMTSTHRAVEQLPKMKAITKSGEIIDIVDETEEAKTNVESSGMSL